MARVKGAINARKKHKKILKLARGYFGARSRQFRAANPAVMRSLRYAYIGRRLKKRDFRSLWITRINAEARNNGMSYSNLINGLKKAGVMVNRKILADMAVNDKNAFAGMVSVAKQKLNA